MRTAARAARPFIGRVAGGRLRDRGDRVRLGQTARPGRWCVIRRAGPWPVPGRSGGPEGEGVEVVGQDRPGGPGTGAGVALEPGSVEAVASFEVADAAFGADAELGQAAVGLAGVRGVVAADKQPVGLGQMLGGPGRVEAAVERDLARPQIELGEPLAGGRAAAGTR